MHRRRAVIALFTCVAAGCGTSGRADSTGAVAARSDLTPIVASSTYPDHGIPGEELAVGVIINRKSDTITLHNFSERWFPCGKVWVNRSFVAPLRALPARGSVTLSRGSFQGGDGRTLEGQPITAMQVDLEASGQLFQLQGPLVE